MLHIELDEQATVRAYTDMIKLYNYLGIFTETYLCWVIIKTITFSGERVRVAVPHGGSDSDGLYCNRSHARGTGSASRVAIVN